MTPPSRALFREHLEIMDRRLEAALEQSGLNGLIVYAGTAPMPDWDDQPYPFRPYPFFTQWCPQSDPAGSALILEPGCKPKLVTVAHDDFWHAPPAPPDGEWADCFTIETAGNTHERDRMLARLAQGFGELGPDPGRARADDGRRKRAEVARRCLEFDRAIKTPYELSCIAEANRIAVKGHRAVERAFSERCDEATADFSYMQASGQRGIDLPYPNIVALNAHAAILHYQNLDNRSDGARHTLLIDAGARHRGYAADITRTNLSATSALRELHASMDELQQALSAQAVAGVEFTDLNAIAHQLLATVLVDHGLVTSSASSAYESGITTAFLPHGLGHLLGLQVHDVAGWQREPHAPPTPPPKGHPYLRLTRRLEPGFVVTIEPGIYFIESIYRRLPADRRALIDHARFESLLPHGGIRIEDDVAVEAGDNINLTRNAFAEPVT